MDRVDEMSKEAVGKIDGMANLVLTGGKTGRTATVAKVGPLAKMTSTTTLRAAEQGRLGLGRTVDQPKRGRRLSSCLGEGGGGVEKGATSRASRIPRRNPDVDKRRDLPPRATVLAVVIKQYGVDLYRTCVSLRREYIVEMGVFADEKSAEACLDRFWTAYDEGEIRDDDDLTKLAAKSLSSQSTHTSGGIEEASNSGTSRMVERVHPTSIR